MKVSVGAPLAMMVSAMGLELSMGSKRAKAMWAAMRKTVKVRAMLMVAARCFFLQAQEPAGGGADEQGDGGENGGQAQGGEGRAGEVEEVGHGERVIAYGAMGQQGADVGDDRAGCARPRGPSRERWRRARR